MTSEGPCGLRPDAGQRASGTGVSSCWPRGACLCCRSGSGDRRFGVGGREQRPTALGRPADTQAERHHCPGSHLGKTVGGRRGGLSGPLKGVIQVTLRKSCLAAVCPRSKVLSGPWAPVTASLADDAADTPLCMQLAPWRPGAASSRTSPVPEKFCAHWALRPQIPFSSPGLQMWWLYSPGAPASWDIVKVPQDTTQGPGRASRGRRRLRQQDLPWVCEQGPAALPM